METWGWIITVNMSWSSYNFGYNYCDRLKACKLPPLHYRRLRGDMIETFKIGSGKYDSCAAPILTGLHFSITRGHDLRLEKFRARYDLRKYFFTNRVANNWNSLPSHVVHTDSVNSFKSRLDNFWKSQDVLCDYHAEIHGTGSRSEASSKFGISVV